MKILMIDPLRTEATKKIGRFNDYQQLGTAKALVDAGQDVTIGVFNDIIEIPEHKTINILDRDNINDFEVVIVTGFSANFFGGVEILSVTNTYRLLAKYTGKLLYYFTDLAVVFADISKRIVEDTSFSFYGQNRKDFKVKKSDIIIHSFNEEVSRPIVEKQIKGIKVDKMYNYPIQASSFYIKDDSEIAVNMDDIYNREYDLFYSSFSIRGHRRDQKMIDYYFDNDLKTVFTGKAKLDNFKNYEYTQHPEFAGRIKEEEFLPFHRKSMATVVIGDKNYYDHFFAKRIIEGIIAQQVVFIDEDYDREHRLMPHRFFYVNNKEQVKDRIEKLKANPDLHRQVIEMQNKVFEERYSKQAFLEATKELAKQIERDLR